MQKNVIKFVILCKTFSDGFSVCCTQTQHMICRLLSEICHVDTLFVSPTVTVQQSLRLLESWSCDGHVIGAVAFFAAAVMSDYRPTMQYLWVWLMRLCCGLSLRVGWLPNIGSRALALSDPYYQYACLSVVLSATLGLNISETRPDSLIVPMDSLQELAYGISIAHAPDDVT